MISAGDRFGALVATERSVEKKWRVYWLCNCDCGAVKKVRADGLVSGVVKSCGAGLHRRNKPLSHGQTYTTEYKRWDAMIQRCTNKKNRHYKYYGARGISVCERWRSFENFFADMGRVPKGMTLDRINNDGNYEPSNCRWATWAEQHANKRPYGTALGCEAVARFEREMEAA